MKAIHLLTLAFLTIACAAFQPNHDHTEGYQIGDVATDFKLKNIDGKMVSMSDYEEAKGFIVIFTCNHCPFSVMYEDRIIELDQQFKEQGYPVLAINPNDDKAYPEDSFDNMIVRAEEKGFTFPYLHDETQEIAHQYGATKTPHVFLLQKENKELIVKYIGAIDDSTRGRDIEEKYVEMAIQQIIEGKDVDPATTKAVGCSIKWKKH